MAKEESTRAVLARTDNSEGLAGLLSAVLTQTQVIQNADNVTDSKANNLMAAALVIIALLGTMLKDQAGNWMPLTIVSMGVLIVDVFIVLYSMRGRVYLGAVVDLKKHPEYFSFTNKLLLAQLIEDAVYANESNNEILATKQKLFRWAMFVFLSGFALGIGALFLYN